MATLHTTLKLIQHASTICCNKRHALRYHRCILEMFWCNFFHPNTKALYKSGGIGLVHRLTYVSKITFSGYIWGLSESGMDIRTTLHNTQLFLNKIPHHAVRQSLSGGGLGSAWGTGPHMSWWISRRAYLHPHLQNNTNIVWRTLIKTHTHTHLRKMSQVCHDHVSVLLKMWCHSCGGRGCYFWQKDI